MAIKFVRDEKGNLVAVDDKTGKEIGKMTTMGDELKKEKKFVYIFLYIHIIYNIEEICDKI